MRLPSKFNNIPTEVDGYRFDSRLEARRYLELRTLEKAGQIECLTVDKKALRFPLVVNGVKVCVYEADFIYHELPSGRRIVEDCKGCKTHAYRIKAQLMKAVHGIEILETGKR